jgi:hypothetical protein
MSDQRNSLQPSLIVFGISLIIFVFVAGSIFAINNWPPVKYIVEGYEATKTLIKEMTQIRSSLLLEHTYEGNGVVKHDPNQAYQGMTVLQGIFPGGTQLRLIDMDGNLIHTWPLDFFAIWPNPVHLSEEKIPRTPYDYHTQGNYVFPDGSIIANLGYLGTVKLDKCGKVLWTVDRMTRHFVSPTPDGYYWIGANRNIDDIAEELLFFDIDRSFLKEGFQRYENTVLVISPDGEIVDEFSVLKAFHDAGYEGHIFDAFKIDKTDLTHHNDIEVVSHALAKKIEGVNEGDYLLSIRNMHMLIILDQHTRAIKWTYSGSWTRQHDADITPDGNIIVFNNSRKNFGFRSIAGSSLIELDPLTRQTRVVYPNEGQPGFFTDIFGTHQTLPNGNILISEGKAGRVFEINQQGDIVWDFVSPYDDSYASLVEAAHRYDLGYFSVTDWQCEQSIN